MRMSAPAAFAFNRLVAVRARHAHQIAIGAERDLRPLGKADRVVDAGDRQHADRAAGPVDHADIGGQQVFQAVARDRVRVPAAELHEIIIAIGRGLGGDAPGDRAGEAPVAIFVDMSHDVAPANARGEAASRRSASVRSASASSILASA